MDRPSTGGYNRDSRGGVDRPSTGGYNRDSRGGVDRPSTGGYNRDSRGGSDRPGTGGHNRNSGSGSSRPTGGGYNRDSRSGSDRPTGGGAYNRGSRSGSDRPSTGGHNRDSRAAQPYREEAPRPAGPAIPDGLDPKMLDRAVLRDLNTLGGLADKVALHLVAAGMLMDSDDAAALAHARAARDLAPRIAAVREAAGLAAYRNEEWAEAARDLRAARRMTGDNTHLPILADCERALGKPERALEIATAAEVDSLPKAVQAELVIVHAGARRDLGELAGAKRILERFGVDESVVQPWSVRTWYAYADVLVAQGDLDGGRHWFQAVSELDRDGETDAEERLVELSSG